MNEIIEKLKKEIEDLEKQLEANPFGGLFARNRQDQLYHRLKKKRKELAELEKRLAEPAKPEKTAKKPSVRKKAETRNKPG